MAGSHQGLSSSLHQGLLSSLVVVTDKMIAILEDAIMRSMCGQYNADGEVRKGLNTSMLSGMWFKTVAEQLKSQHK